MVRAKTINELILNSLDYFRVVQPAMDTKPGTKARDVFVENPSIQMSRLYDELNRVSNLSSLSNSIGADLEKFAKNFGAVKKKGSKATVPALLTFNSLDADIPVNKGDLLTAKNGSSFQVINGIVISPVLINNYRATASRFRADLDFLGNTDQFAVEVLVEATAAGRQGNISKYGLVSTTMTGIDHVTNVFPAGGGTDTEDDATFKSRVISIFSGSNVGTALGYRNAVLADNSVVDALVIEPGDTLMTRDGTQTATAADGTVTVVTEGTGGKVDIYVFGSRLQETTDSFVYRDRSNTGDPTNTQNDFVLGQIAGDENKTVTRKRIDNLATGILPNQPINNLVSVAGSLSGPNFIEKSVDALGRVTGNYELIRDQGAFGGSPWGFDRLRWISDRISDLPEDKTKVLFNSQDPLNFTDVLEISKIQQNIIVTNENSKVSATNRSSIQLVHFPCSSVTRVFNVTTGERYIITNQNPDGTGSVNSTGRILISGKSLPAISDTLQVDYTWVYDYDPYFDFDNLLLSDNVRTVENSIDWGYSNLVRREEAILLASGSYLTALVTHPISSVISVNVFSTHTAEVSLSSERLVVVVPTLVSNVVSIIRVSDGAEIWNTNADNGTFKSFTIFLPTDTVAIFGDTVSIVYNAIDVFNANTQGSFNNNTIIIVPSSTATVGTLVECNYIANINTLLPATTLSNLPAIRSSNYFNTNTANNIGSQPATHLFSGSSIVKNLRQAPSNLAFTVAGTTSQGTFTVTGTTITSILDTVITCSANGLKQDLSAAIRATLGINSKTNLSSNIKIARLSKAEKVDANTSNDVLSVITAYDVKGYQLKDNSLVKSESIINTSLKNTEIILPSTTTNNSDLPVIGDKLRISFHIMTSNDSENIIFSRTGTQYSSKRFASVDVISISSGFSSTASQSATVTVANFNQPTTKARYKAYYDFLAPKSNERISVTYNFEKLIPDATLALENSRPITADVLVKASTPLLVDVTMNIVVTSDFENSSTIVKQNVLDAITTALQATALGTTIDASDLIQVAYTVTGVDRARVVVFNETDSAGSVLSITAKKNEFIFPNEVVVEIESR